MWYWSDSGYLKVKEYWKFHKNHSLHSISVLEVAIGVYDVSLDKLVAAAELIPGDQKSVTLTTMLSEESKVAFFFRNFSNKLESVYSNT